MIKSTLSRRHILQEIYSRTSAHAMYLLTLRGWPLSLVLLQPFHLNVSFAAMYVHLIAYNVNYKHKTRFAIIINIVMKILLIKFSVQCSILYIQSVSHVQPGDLKLQYLFIMIVQMQVIGIMLNAS